VIAIFSLVILLIIPTIPFCLIPLFKIRAFAAGNIVSLILAMGRGGMQFMLIVWLQGV
jgi:hypothetical protein